MQAARREKQGGDDTLRAAAGPKRIRRTNVERSADTRRQIMDAVIDIMSRYGFSALTNSLIVSTAGVSSGALMHHFPTRQELLVATVAYAYERLAGFRAERLSGLTPGMERYRALIDLAWMTSRMPEGLAVSEMRIGARSDSELAKALSPTMSHIAQEYGRFVGRHARAAGLESTQELRGLTAATSLAMRFLAIDRVTYQSQTLEENVLVTFRTMREDIIARQLGEHARQDPRIACEILYSAKG